MIFGIGVDTVDIARFTRALDRAPGLAARILSESERAMPIASQAARFAAREAAVKALGGLHEGLTLLDLEVVREPLGPPRFVRHERLEGVLRGLGVTGLHLSITHDANVATAFVIAEATGPAGRASAVEAPAAASAAAADRVEGPVA